MAELTAKIGTRRRRIGPALAAVALSLSACSYLDNFEDLLKPPPPVEETVVITTPEPEAEPAEPSAPPAATRRPRPPPQPPRTARLTPPAPERPPPQPMPTPEIKLVGVSREQAETLLGAPSEQREAAPAKIWQYRAGECVVDLYFYLDVARNEFFALHYDVRNDSAAVGGEAAERCLQRIYSEKHK